MQIIYNIILFLLFLLYLPYFLLRRKFNKEFVTRCGFISPEIKEKLKNKQTIWIHTVSVGEFIAARPFIQELKKQFPDKILVVSCVTQTANSLAKKFISNEDVIIYSPLDISFIARSFVRFISPCLYICLETELWPNIICELKKNNVPIMIINGRISDKSFRGYKKISFMLKNILNKIDIFCMQTTTDARRIIELGAQVRSVKLTGNMKFDLEYENIFKQINLKINPSDIILIAGSTHPGEEKIILNVYKKLREEFKNLKVIIAPRHIERTKLIEKLINDYGFSFDRLSRTISLEKIDICLVDTMGQLTSLYNLGQIIFMGGSLVKKGGHNILEPAIFSKPIIFGPFMFNFRDIADLFLSQKAAILVRNEFGLLTQIKFLIENPKERQLLGDNALRVVQNNRGATKKNLEIVKEILNK